MALLGLGNPWGSRNPKGIGQFEGVAITCEHAEKVESKSFQEFCFEQTVTSEQVFNFSAKAKNQSVVEHFAVKYQWFKR